MKKDGKDQFQILADYDRTISATQACPSFGVLRDSDHVPKSFQQEIKGYFNHYYPIEKKPGIPFDEKFMICEEWCEKARGTYVKY